MASHEQGRSYLVVWKKHPYVTAGYTGVKRVAVVDGVSVVDYVLDTVKLVDPYEGPGDLSQEKRARGC